MRPAYDAALIRDHRRSLGHLPLIDTVARSAAHKAAKLARLTINRPLAEAVRYKARSAAKHIFACLQNRAPPDGPGRRQHQPRLRSADSP
jgi:hypothetical protein